MLYAAVCKRNTSYALGPKLHEPSEIRGIPKSSCRDRLVGDRQPVCLEPDNDVRLRLRWVNLGSGRYCSWRPEPGWTGKAPSIDATSEVNDSSSPTSFRRVAPTTVSEPSAPAYFVEVFQQIGLIVDTRYGPNLQFEGEVGFQKLIAGVACCHRSSHKRTAPLQVRASSPNPSKNAMNSSDPSPTVPKRGFPIIRRYRQST